MIRSITECIFDGYGSGQTDFLVRLNQADPALAVDFEISIITPLLEVLANPDQTGVLTITGHSDRVDTPGLTREQRREQELQASADRSDSAEAGIKQILASRMAGPAPADWDDVQQLAFLSRVAGAAVLKEGGASLSEQQRRRNRRVQFRVVRFQP